MAMFSNFILCIINLPLYCVGQLTISADTAFVDLLLAVLVLQLLYAFMANKMRKKEKYFHVGSGKKMNYHHYCSRLQDACVGLIVENLHRPVDMTLIW